MNNQEKIAFLSKISLLSNVSPELLSELAKIATEREYAKGDLIIQEQMDASEIFIIVKGSVSVYRSIPTGEIINLATLGPNEILGEISFIDNQTRSATVEALQPTTVLVFPATDVKKLFLQDPKTALHVMEILVVRVKELHNKIEDLTTKNLEQRTMRTIEILAKYYPDNKITLSQEELAEIIGATRARVTEVLNLLQTKGKVKLAHKTIEVLS